MIAELPAITNPWPTLLSGGVLTLCRLGGVVAFAPPFRGNNIPLRVRAVFVLALTWLAAPMAVNRAQAPLELTAVGVASECVLGLLLGIGLSFVSESLLYAGSLMSISFSFSLANLLDPNSQVETDVLSTLLNWLGVLVLLTAGLHRVMLAAVLHSFAALPLGTVAVSSSAGHALVDAASGIFFAGLQLAAPVLAAALLVEVALGLMGRLAPGLPVQMLNVPVKTIVAYGVLATSVALWPGWIEHHFTALLDAAQRTVRL
ncbi:flagellar biosynthetic protein FliR [Terriglobus sp.]|uniref:flagellar biosynthetic protein FliR n=1 Tax=Terriglobus sp. TaxID=1889013 RepID=UPI003B004C72